MRIVKASFAAKWFSLVVFVALPASAADRPLVRVSVPHDTVYIDTSSIQRRGSEVTFNYVLDVLAAAEGRSAAGGWKSNEVVATIDCAQNTFSAGRIIAYAGPRASGVITGGHTPTAEERKPAKLIVGSTTAYLANYVCTKL